jgi:hypothetical protein
MARKHVLKRHRVKQPVAIVAPAVTERRISTLADGTFAVEHIVVKPTQQGKAMGSTINRAAPKRRKR